jgi:hypothetical protein
MTELINKILLVVRNNASRDISVGIATRLRAGGPGLRFRFPTGTTDFSLLHNVEADFGSTQNPTKGVQGREADHTSPSNAVVKNGGTISPFRRSR